MSLSEFESFLYKNIPATQTMGLKLISFKNHELRATLPLEPNINDKGTLFGGSASSAMIISGWSLIKLLCLQHKISNDIVIASNKTKWTQPLDHDAMIVVSLESDWSIEELKLRLSSKQSTRIPIKAVIHNSYECSCAIMTATYFIIANVNE